MKTLHSFSAASARLARGVIPGLAVLAALGLMACDSRTESGSSATATGGGGDAVEDCPEITALSRLEGAPVCTADGTAEGADVMCYQICGGSIVTVVETGTNLYGYHHAPDTGDPATNIGLVMNSGPGNDTDGIALVVNAAAGSTGTSFEIGRFSSWSGPNTTHYRAIGSTEGEGQMRIDQYDDVDGIITGQFEAILCAYNGTTHQVQCESGSLYIKGAFDITRTANVTGGTGTPF